MSTARCIVLICCTAMISFAIAYGATIVAVRFEELTASVKEGQTCTAGVKSLMDPAKTRGG